MEFNFLELVQMTARESGTVPSEQPQTVQGQTGRLAKVVHWVNLAWHRIQISRAQWQWMHDTFEGETSPGLSLYSPLQLNITRFAQWVTLPNTMTIYRKSDGKSQEIFIQPVEYWRYRRLYDVGVQSPAEPACFSVSPGGLLVFGPTPDDEYVVRGEYYKSPQELVLDTDIPELPLRHRPIIAWYALLLLSEYDEGGFAVAVAQRRYREHMTELERDQLPTLHMFRRLV